MLANIRLSALCLGAFIGYVMPIAVSVWIVTSLQGADHAAAVLSASGFWGFLTLLLLGGPVAGGFIAARHGKSQPLTHGLLTALIGWLVSTLYGTGWLVGIVYVLASVTGAAAWRAQNG